LAQGGSGFFNGFQLNVSSVLGSFGTTRAVDLAMAASGFSGTDTMRRSLGRCS
jgi:hypothetical protein